jgi:hypothetical protein
LQIITVVDGKDTKKEKAKESSQKHESLFSRVYVNEIGRHTLLNEADPKYPVGTIIVREKFWGGQDAQPELVTVMAKRQKGFNALINDWEFLIFDGPKMSKKTDVKTENCLACHKQKEKDDFVFRTYLPAPKH